MLTSTNRTEFGKLLDDISEFTTWSRVSREYFGKSATWFYNKVAGRDGNGGTGDFSPEERLQLRDALLDMSARLRRTADAITLRQEEMTALPKTA